MFKGLRFKIQSVVKGCASGYHIRIRAKGNRSYYVDDCKENWDILNNLNNETSRFVYFKDSSERDGGVLGVEVEKIIAFHITED